MRNYSDERQGEPLSRLGQLCAPDRSSRSSRTRSILTAEFSVKSCRLGVRLLDLRLVLEIEYSRKQSLSLSLLSVLSLSFSPFVLRRARLSKSPGRALVYFRFHRIHLTRRSCKKPKDTSSSALPPRVVPGLVPPPAPSPFRSRLAS